VGEQVGPEAPGAGWLTCCPRRDMTALKEGVMEPGLVILYRANPHEFQRSEKASPPARSA
jgi:hypothetical protein